MNRIGYVIPAMALSALLATVPFGDGQKPSQERDRDQERTHQQQRQQDRKAQPKSARQQRQQERNSQAKPAPRQQQRETQRQRSQPSQRNAGPPRTYTPQQQRDMQRWQERQMRRTPQQQRSQQVEQRRIWQRYRAAHNWEAQRRTWRQRGGYNGYRVPDYYFNRYYGRNHWFRVYNLPFLYVDGYPRIQYAGYWFVLLDPYPPYWDPYWYETDDCYIDYYMDGYYLFNLRYPGRPGIAVRIIF